MESKYYTPGISEFHVGFEYEEKSYTREDYGQYIIEEDFATPPLLAGIESKAVLVKYLDKEDIESLGFVCCGKDDEFDFIGYKNNDNYEIQDWGDNKYSIERFPYFGTLKTVCFCGLIKNKSELKKLMIQLGIK